MLARISEITRLEFKAAKAEQCLTAFPDYDEVGGLMLIMNT